MKSIVFMIIILAIPLAFHAFAQQPSCDYKVEILSDGKEFEADNFKWRMRATKIEGSPTNITGTAEIKADGKVIKSYRPWTSEPISKQKTSGEYSPNLKENEYEIIAAINVTCDDLNKNNNIYIKRIKIIKNKQETTNNKNNNQAAEQNISNSLQGAINESNNSVAQSNKEEITNNKFVNQDQQNNQSSGTANEEMENTIELHPTNNQKNQLQPTTINAVQEPIIIYESSNEKAKNMIIISLLALSVLLNIVLIWKR